MCTNVIPCVFFCNPNKDVFVLNFDFSVATHLLLGTGTAALKTPAFHRSILDPVDSQQFTLEPAAIDARFKKGFLYGRSLYLGWHVVGVVNHHRTGEVLVEVVYILAHSGAGRVEDVSGTS